MAETELQQPQPQKVEIPPVIEEQTRGGKQYRAYQKQNPDATTWESHVGSMLGSLGFISFMTAASYSAAGAAGAVSAVGATSSIPAVSAAAGAATAAPGIFTGLASAIGLSAGSLAAGAFSLALPMAIAVGMSYAGGWIGQKIGKARVEKENAEGKVYSQPSSLNHEAVEQGFSGAFIWKALTAITVGLGMGAIGMMGFEFAKGDYFLGLPKAAIVLTTSLAAAAYGGFKGIFSGMGMGKARMEREYQDAELINALQTGKGVPVRTMATGIDSPAVGRVAGVAAGVTSAVDPSTVIHAMPGVLGEKANDTTANDNYLAGKVGGNKQYRDFSDLGEAHPAYAKKINFAQREMDRALAKEQTTQPVR